MARLYANENFPSGTLPKHQSNKAGVFRWADGLIPNPT